MAVLEVEGVTYYYNKGTPMEIAAIDDICFSVEAGECVGVIGHTGSGKSTLMQHLNGLLRPDQGKILVEGKDIWENPKAVRPFRFLVGLVFQYPEYQLFEETVYRDIAFGPKNMGLSETEIDRRVRETAALLGLPEETLDQSPFDLSGGQKRRVAIAGVIAMQPKVLVLDEPTAGLDPKGRDDIFAMIKAYHRDYHGTVILVSHSMEDVAAFANRVLVLNHGRVEMLGSVNEVFQKADRLLEIGLEIPEITHVFRGLKARGLPVPEDVYTLEEGRRLLLELFEKEEHP